MKVVGKEVYSRREMQELGYPVRLLAEISRNPDLTDCFFRTGTGRTSNIYYHKKRVDRFLEMREDERMVAKR